MTSPGGSYNAWTGERVRLRGVEPSDWEKFQAWDHDSEAQRHGWMLHFPRSQEGTKKWAQERATAEIKDDNYFWVIESLDGEAVGLLNTHGCNQRDGTFEFGISVDREHWGKGYAPEALGLLLRFFFGERRYQKVTSHVYDFNERSQAMHRKFGFVDEGRIRRGLFTDGRYHDILILGMTNDEFWDRYGR